MAADTKAVAGAGVGKTAVLEEIARRRSGKGLYVVFNAAMQKEASGRFPTTINCRTGHSLAYRALNMRSQGDRLVSRLQPTDIARWFGIRARDGGYLTAWRAIEVLKAFCRTTDRAIDAAHVRAANLRLLLPGDEAQLTELADRLWADVCDPKGQTGITHDHYLKQFQLSGKPLAERPSYMLVDEAQDCDPVLMAIVQAQRVPTMWVGDHHQQLYRWRGAVNAMRQIAAPEYPLMTSFRFGQALANVANVVLSFKIDKPTWPLVGSPARQTIIDASQPAGRYVVLCRTNAGVFDMAARTLTPLHVIGGYQAVVKLVQAAFALWKGTPQPHVPALSSFSSWADLVHYIEDVADPELRFLARMIDTYGDGLPGLIESINARHRAEHDAEVIISTVHGYKGRQSSIVVLAEDFPAINDELRFRNPAAYDDELNILYVAVTRAIEVLVVNSDRSGAPPLLSSTRQRRNAAA